MSFNPDNFFLRYLKLINFTAFEEAEFEFVPQGLNVFVGENGTGKTHAMKALYSALLSQSDPISMDRGLNATVTRVMQADSLADITRQNSAETWVHYGNQGSSNHHFGNAADTLICHYRGIEFRVPRPVFIPAVDMMGHTKKFGDAYDLDYLDFDYCHRDIVRLLATKNILANGTQPKMEAAVPEGLLPGAIRYDEDEQRFYLWNNDQQWPMQMVAEGLRKVATLRRLLENGWLLPGTTLFWDEPEANLNPKLMDDVVEAMLYLVRGGVQIFIATHSYLILEEISDRAQDSEVRYFGFAPGPAGVKVNAFDNLDALDPNPVLDQYQSLSNRLLKKAFLPQEQP